MMYLLRDEIKPTITDLSIGYSTVYISGSVFKVLMNRLESRLQVIFYF